MKVTIVHEWLDQPASSGELCWHLGDAVIRRRFVLACR